ncbi:Hypothetical_protein [Hexamita inflata]|uniref:Hypothetical_protein n=1 Tax=Hexamita inflata TaxID=28002 RepID=A0AA86PHR5_9EUKA|nr:Hypothetical protein HINF_LOCUS26142 [Hexamita inflata]
MTCQNSMTTNVSVTSANNYAGVFGVVNSYANVVITNNLMNQLTVVSKSSRVRRKQTKRDCYERNKYFNILLFTGQNKSILREHTIQYIFYLLIALLFKYYNLRDTRIGSAKSVAEGKIPRFKVFSCVKDRYDQGHAINEPSGLESGLLPQKRRWYDAGEFPYRSACTKQPRYAPERLYSSRWLPLLQCLTYIGVFKTNDHSRELTVPVQRTELVQTKVK